MTVGAASGVRKLIANKQLEPRPRSAGPRKATMHHPAHQPHHDTPPGPVLPGQPEEDPIPPEMAPEQDLPVVPTSPAEPG